MKKILVLETSEEINGGQKMSLLVSDELKSKKNKDIVWLVPKQGSLQKKLNEQGYKVYYFGNVSLPSGKKNLLSAFKYFFMSLKSIHRINLVIKKEKIDAIYAPGPASLPWSAVSGKLKRKPVFWHLHHNFEDGLTKKLLFFTSKYKSVKKIISVSSSVASQLKNNEKVMVVYNPVDFKKYNNGDLSNLGNDISLYKNKKTINLLHIGLITPTKKQDVSVALTNHLNSHGIETNLWIIGDKDTSFPNYCDSITNICESNSFIHYVGKQHNVEDWLKLADATVIPSIEGFPLAGLESLSAGVPLITINSSGAKELSEASGCGITFENNDFSIVEKNIHELIANKTVKQRAIDFASSLDISKYIDTINNILDE